MFYKFRKLFLSFLLLVVFSSFTLSADDYYICVASYWNESFAVKLVENLEKEGISAVIDELQKGYDTYYRVLINMSFDTAEEAKAKCREVESLRAIENLDLEGLWICKGSNVQLKEAKPLPSEKKSLPAEQKPAVEAPQEKTVTIEPVILTTNRENKIVLTEEKPYSVLVRTYKDAQVAENDRNRLINQNIEAYILKTYDEVELFTFNLQAGAYETPQEAEDLQKKLEDSGIEGTKIVDYDDIKDSVEKYEEVVQEEQVVFETVNAELPQNFSEDTKICIRQFPVNKDFQIINMSIVDLENARKYDYDDYSSYSGLAAVSNAVSSVKYRDDLFHKDIYVTLFSGKPGTYQSYLFDRDDNPFAEEEKTYIGIINYSTAYGTVECKLYQNGKDFYLNGINKDKSFQIVMEAQNFTLNQFNDFLNNSYNDSSYLVYPQLRKSLYTLPKQNDSVRRDFVSFTLYKVDMTYAEEKRYADWALGIVGHWNSSGTYYQEDKLVSIDFFDLEYDYNAKQIHQIFMEDKNDEGTSSTNHPVALFDSNGWYLLNYYNFNEISFSTKSFIIAIDSYRRSGMLSEEDLIGIAKDLQIWE